MTALHKDLPDSELHEAKGASSATNGQILSANGDGTATFVDPPGAGIFGNNFQYASSDAQSSTTQTTPQNKLQLTANGLPAGNYLLMWYFEWTGDSTNEDVRARVTQDGTTELGYLSAEPKDAGTDQNFPCSGFVDVNISGNHTF